MMEIETPGKRKVWRDRTAAKMLNTRANESLGRGPADERKPIKE
jgi:hypothetical protein